jgi:hypothetical protein
MGSLNIATFIPYVQVSTAMLTCPAQPWYLHPYPATPDFLSRPPLVHRLEGVLLPLFGMLVVMRGF